MMKISTEQAMLLMAAQISQDPEQYTEAVLCVLNPAHIENYDPATLLTQALLSFNKPEGVRWAMARALGKLLPHLDQGQVDSVLDLVNEVAPPKSAEVN